MRVVDDGLTPAQIDQIVDFERVQGALEDAIAMAQSYASAHPTRKASVAVTNLETGLLWFNAAEPHFRLGNG